MGSVRNPYVSWIVASAVCSSFGHFALKLGAVHIGNAEALFELVTRLGTNRWLIAGVVLHTLGLVLWVVGLRHVELSVAYPFVTFSLVLVNFLSWAFLREALGAVQIAGMLLIICGVMLVART